jgi:hypothetical protein
MTKRQADLGPLLLATRADATELTGEGQEPLSAAATAADTGESRRGEAASQILLERSAGSVGQRTLIVKEPLVVGLEEQIQVLSDRKVQVGPLRPPGPVDVRRSLIHKDQEEQDHCRSAEVWGQQRFASVEANPG